MSLITYLPRRRKPRGRLLAKLPGRRHATVLDGIRKTVRAHR